VGTSAQEIGPEFGIIESETMTGDRRLVHDGEV
jgi:hypothetical protein